MVWRIRNENRGEIVNKIYSNPQSDICQIKVSRKRAEDWDIVVETSTPQYQQRLNAALLIEVLPRNEVTTTFYRLRTENMAAIINFVKVIKANEPDFEAIERDISECLGINLNSNYATPYWIKSSFHGSGTESFDYRTGNAGSIINRISLYKQESINGWTIKIFTNTPDDNQRLQTVIATSILPPNWVTLDNRDAGQPFALRTASTAMITNFIKLIKPLTQRFEDIETEISQKLDIDLNQEYLMPASETLSDANLRIVQLATLPRISARPVAISQGFFGRTNQSLAQPPFPTSLTSGNNEKRMENIINFLPTEIPDHYKCSLSLTIMTDPVYLPGDTTKQRFERNWITAWLNSKGTHPSTRERFQSNGLVSDAELKQEINEFLQIAETTIKRQLS